LDTPSYEVQLNKVCSSWRLCG